MSMLSELEKLLREVTEQQGGPAPGRQRPTQPRPVQPIEAEILDERDLEVIAEPRTSIASRKLDTTDVTGHANHLGDRLGQREERLESQRHKKFDRDLTTLDDHAKTVDQQQTAATGMTGSVIADMLRKPENIRSAIILSEILKRPDERW